MAVHTLEPERYHNTIGPHEPAVRVNSGDAVRLTTVDARGRDHHGNVVADRPNPMTGPIWVNSASPGDVLAVRFDRIQPNRKTGYTNLSLAANTVDPQSIDLLPDCEPWTGIWEVDGVNGLATLVSPQLIRSAETPVRPMLGCFGNAPDKGQAISTATSGSYGGNMDWNGFEAGVLALLPVFQPGALFHLGDGHAAQGDGELLGTGIEISMEVEVTLWLKKRQSPILWPRAVTKTHRAVVGNARPLDQALQHATTEMLRWLIEDGFTSTEASLALGMFASYDIANVYNPAYSVVCKLPLERFPVSLLPS